MRKASSLPFVWFVVIYRLLPGRFLIGCREDVSGDSAGGVHVPAYGEKDVKDVTLLGVLPPLGRDW